MNGQNTIITSEIMSQSHWKYQQMISNLDGVINRTTYEIVCRNIGDLTGNYIMN
jgi:hypothetical protein